MQQILQTLLGKLTASTPPDFLAGFKGPTSMGKVGRGGKGREGWIKGEGKGGEKMFHDHCMHQANYLHVHCSHLLEESR